MNRRLSAILFYDVVGYSRSMHENESATIEAIKANRKAIIDPQAKLRNGRTIQVLGDGGFMEFASAVDATRFAIVMQTAVAERNLGLPEEQCLVFRIGINIGDVGVDGDLIYGDGVNIAARLEGLALPGGICVHQTVRDQVHGKLGLTFEFMGDKKVKNIAETVAVYRIVLDEKAAALVTSLAQKHVRQARRSPLRPVHAAVLALFLVVTGLIWWQTQVSQLESVPLNAMALSLPEKPSIAVLALDDLSNGDNRGYLSDAISEGIITELSRFSELFVIARNSSFKYRDNATDVRDIATELGVHYVLEGSQQKDGNKLRVTVQLIDAISGTHIWTEKYDRGLEDLFAVQDDVVRSIASAIGAKIAFRPPPTGGQARLSALQHHLKARQLFRKWTKEDTAKALVENEAAIEADPTSPFGYIGLTFVYLRGSSWGWTELEPDEALVRAREMAEKALELDPNNYAAHNALANVHILAGEQKLALARLKRSIKLNPSASNVMAALAQPLVYTGRAEEAIEILHQAMRLDPHHPDWFKWNLGWAQ